PVGAGPARSADPGRVEDGRAASDPERNERMRPARLLGRSRRPCNPKPLDALFRDGHRLDLSRLRSLQNPPRHHPGRENHPVGTVTPFVAFHSKMSFSIPYKPCRPRLLDRILIKRANSVMLFIKSGSDWIWHIFC